MPDEDCPEYARLAAEAHAILERLAELAEAQKKAFDADDGEAMMRLDKELEMTVGKKERTIGALRAHSAIHHCKKTFLPEF